jgi:hypothetical protein
MGEAQMRKLKSVIREVNKSPAEILRERSEADLLDLVNVAYLQICADAEVNVQTVSVPLTAAGGVIEHMYDIPENMVMVRVLTYYDSANSIPYELRPKSATRHDARYYGWRRDEGIPTEYFMEGRQIGLYPKKRGTSVSGGYPKFEVIGHMYVPFTSVDQEIDDILFWPLVTGVNRLLFESAVVVKGTENALFSYEKAMDELGRNLERLGARIPRTIGGR